MYAKAPVFVILFAVSSLAVKAQLPCTQILKRAQDDYEAGYVSKIPESVSNCLIEGFTKEERIRANKLVTLAYLFKDDVTDAEQYMTELLRTDPEHQLDGASDPREIFYLYSQFRTRPIFRIRVAGFGNYTFVNTLRSYGVENIVSSPESFTGAAVGGIGVEIEREILDRFDVSLGLQLSLRRYGITNQIADYSQHNLTEDQQSLDVPLGLRYYFSSSGQMRRIYLSGGAGTRFVINAVLSGSREGGQVVSVPDEDQNLLRNAQRKLINYYAFLGAGFRVRLPNRKNFLFVDFIYHRGVTLVNDAKKRYREPLAFRVGYVDNDFSLDMLQLNVGFIFSIYKPKKLQRYRLTSDKDLNMKRITAKDRSEIKDVSGITELNQADLEDDKQEVEQPDVENAGKE